MNEYDKHYTDVPAVKVVELVKLVHDTLTNDNSLRYSLIAPNEKNVEDRHIVKDKDGNLVVGFGFGNKLYPNHWWEAPYKIVIGKILVNKVLPDINSEVWFERRYRNKHAEKFSITYHKKDKIALGHIPEKDYLQIKKEVGTVASRQVVKYSAEETQALLDLIHTTLQENNSLRYECIPADRRYNFMDRHFIYNRYELPLVWYGVGNLWQNTWINGPDEIHIGYPLVQQVLPVSCEARFSNLDEYANSMSYHPEVPIIRGFTTTEEYNKIKAEMANIAQETLVKKK